MANTEVSSVLILDTSSSMSSSGYDDITIIDSKAFVDQHQPGNLIGVVQFDTNAQSVYRLTRIDQDPQGVRKEVADAIQGLAGKFNGGSTNISAGIELGTDFLSAQLRPRGLVLVSDGYHNTGSPYPLDVLPSEIPIYTCALGPNSDTGLLSDIAENTGGNFYNDANVFDMMQIYNDIQSQAPDNQLITNGRYPVKPLDSQIIPFTLSADNHTGQFSVVWENLNIEYTDSAPSGNQFRLLIADPNNDTVEEPPTIIGDGYVIYNIPNPIPGEWKMAVEYAQGTVDLNFTGGAFEYHNSGSSPIQMELMAPKKIQVGQPLQFTVKATDGNDLIEDLDVSVRIAQPKLSIQNALKYYRELIAGIKLTQKQKNTQLPEERVKLDILRRQFLPKVDLLPTLVYPTFVRRTDRGNYVGAVRDTMQAGAYNIQVQVKGYAKKSGTPFQRNQLVSVVVE
ncbi:MAG: VWA domain-containing protein [Symploca sp. SIO1A3]|nr:VWA domain-containing protein [Symploca sp. SIO1A3]